MIRLALTGGIACGKSLAGAWFREAGWAVCETDTVAHDLYVPGGAAYEAVRALAGPGAILADGRIDRVALGRLVFADPAQRVALNAILHPLVGVVIADWLRASEQEGWPGAVAIIPLLFEAGMEQGWDGVACIGCPASVQRARLQARGLSEEEIEARLAAQWPVDRKMAAAEFQIWNDSTPEALYAAIQDVMARVAGRK